MNRSFVYDYSISFLLQEAYKLEAEKRDVPVEIPLSPAVRPRYGVVSFSPFARSSVKQADSSGIIPGPLSSFHLPAALAIPLPSMTAEEDQK